MFLLEDLWSLLQLLVGKTRLISEKASFFQNLSESMTNSTCGGSELELSRDDSAAFVLKFVAIASILICGFAGVAIPLVGKHCQFLRIDSNLFVVAKAFAAGVILATDFVHILNDASDVLNDPCLSSYPWRKFPFTGFFAMMEVLFTLLLDFVETQYYKQKQGVSWGVEEQTWVGSLESGVESSGIVEVGIGKVFGEEESGGMHIVGMHAHAAHHRHNHPHRQDSCHGIGAAKRQGHAHGHSHADHAHDQPDVRHVVVSQAIG